MSQLELSVETATESEVSGASSITGLSNTESNSSRHHRSEVYWNQPSKRNDVVIDTMTSTSPTKAPHAPNMKCRRYGSHIANIATLLFLFTLVIANFYFFVSYSSITSACDKGKYRIDPDLFTGIAGLTSLPYFIVTVMLWCKGISVGNDGLPENDDVSFGTGKCIFCMSFWNTIWAIFGVASFLQFDAECQSEPIAICILVWSCLQVMCLQSRSFVNVQQCRYSICGHFGICCVHIESYSSHWRVWLWPYFACWYISWP